MHRLCRGSARHCSTGGLGPVTVCKRRSLGGHRLVLGPHDQWTYSEPGPRDARSASGGAEQVASDCVFRECECVRERSEKSVVSIGTEVRPYVPG